MNICNCNIDLDKFLCDIPKEWRDGIVKALCFTLNQTSVNCNNIKNCETLTSLSPFSILGNILNVTYKDENGYLHIASTDIQELLDNVLDDIDPKCLTSPETWATLTHIERIQLLIDESCICCPSTTTTTSTSTTTTSGYTYYYTNEYVCLDGCKQISDSTVIYVPNGFVYSPLYFYQGLDNPDSYYQITGVAPLTIDAVQIDTGSYSLNCNSFCPTTTTSTTTTTTLEPSTTTTTSTSTTSTTTVPIPCTCHTYSIEVIEGISFQYYQCGETVLTTIFLGPGGSTTVCCCEDNLLLTGDSNVTITDLGIGCGGTTTTTSTTTTSSSTTTTTTVEPTTTTTTTTSTSTTSTTTDAPVINCIFYQITTTSSISVEWEDCETGLIFSTTTGGTTHVCAREGTLSITAGEGVITDFGDCTGGTTTTTTSTTTSSSSTTTTSSTTTSSSTTTTTTLVPPGDNVMMINNSLDVEVTSFAIDGIEVDSSYPLTGYQSWSKVTNPVVDVYLQWSTSIGGQSVSLFDTNGSLVACEEIFTGDPTPFITWIGVSMSGSSPLTIDIKDGLC